MENFVDRESSFNEKLYKRHGMSYMLHGNYVGGGTVTAFMCSKHGLYDEKPENVFQGKINGSCKKCKSDYISKRQRKPLYGVAINDSDELTTNTRDYVIWVSMLKRVFEKQYKTYTPTYNDATVSDDWLMFSKFKNDLEQMVGYDKLMIKGTNWVLDKDILKIGNKHYSKETCVIVPHEINMQFRDFTNYSAKLPVGVYLNKESGKFACDVAITVNGERKTKYLGRYKTIEEAFEIRRTHKLDYVKSLAKKYSGQVEQGVINSLLKYNYDIKGNILGSE